MNIYSLCSSKSIILFPTFHSMKKSEAKSCAIMALILEKTSYLVFVLFITIPFLIIMFLRNQGNDALNIFIFLEVFFALLLILQAWHAYIDAKMFRAFIDDGITTKDLDTFLVKIFYRKWLKGKDMQYRIDASIRLLKRFFVSLIIHVVFFVIWFFGFMNNYGNIFLF